MTSPPPINDWMPAALAALPASRVWGVYVEWIYEPAIASVLRDNTVVLPSSDTREARRVPLLIDPLPLDLMRLWQAGQHTAALNLLAGLWLRVREQQRTTGRIPWPADDLLDALQFALRDLDWTVADHRQLSEAFTDHIVNDVIATEIENLAGKDE
ncbi:hypothetical protein [Mycobacteroides abscessus]|uniref:hypothetical protein n=1 Tax=Mycobacteroides abscessus TaxID=36809 RepID=UPI001041E85E|nr:hypothetical protein [Mycobacteroides abscessus]